MASTVQTGGGSGVDLSELTSGELLLCSLLKTGYLNVSGTNVFSGSAASLGISDTHSIDMSKISQISFKSGEYGGTVIWSNISNKFTKNSYTPNVTVSLTAPSEGDNSRSSIGITSGTDLTVTLLEVASFTTTDGKVHTASNLNY